MSALFRNTLAQSSSLVTAFVFSLILAPIMLSRLGLAAFGVWAVTGALAQYFRLLDLGITNSLSRFVALYDAQGDRRAIEELVGVGIFAASCVGLAMFAAAALTAPLVSDVLGVLDADEMRLVLISSAGITLSYLYGAVIAAVPIGLRRMGPPNVAAILGNSVNFVFSVVALAISTELVVYALANLAAAILGLLAVAASLLWVWERPFARPPTVHRGRAVLSFGVKSQLVTLADLVNLQTDKLIIAAMLGPSVAGAYELANRAVQGALSFGTLTLSALIPTATADIVERGRQVIVEYFTRYSVRSLSIALPLFGTLCVSAPYLFVLWLGEVPHDADQIVVLLSFAFAINMTTGVPMTLSVSDGHPGLVAQTAVVLVVLNIALTAAAAPIFGLWGVLLGTVAAQFVASGIFLLRFRRRYSVRAAAFREAFVEPTAVAVLVAVPFALWYALGGPIPESRAPALLGAAATGGVYALACWLIESRRGLLPEKLRVGWLRQRLARPAKVAG
jgi:O-antigen/teichoic acid export membrane protein